MMNYKDALRQGDSVHIEVLDGHAKVVIEGIPIKHIGNSSIEAIRNALEAWESDPAENMYNMLGDMLDGKHFSTRKIAQVRMNYKKGKQEITEMIPQATIITLKYDSVVKIYEAWINGNANCNSDPIEAIQEALENYNYNVHEEMYKVLKEIQKNTKLTKIDKVIKRYESK